MKTTNKQSKEDTFFLYINTLILQISPTRNWKNKQGKLEENPRRKISLKMQKSLTKYV